MLDAVCSQLNCWTTPTEGHKYQTANETESMKLGLITAQRKKGHIDKIDKKVSRLKREQIVTSQQSFRAYYRPATATDT